MVAAHRDLHFRAKETRSGASVSHGGFEFAHAAHCLGLLPKEEAPHGAVPYGNASDLRGDARVAWYESQFAMDPEIPSRVLNGFARVELSNNAIIEKRFAANGTERWSSIEQSPQSVISRTSTKASVTELLIESSGHTQEAATKRAQANT
jgi:hypothetical protein